MSRTTAEATERIDTIPLELGSALSPFGRYRRLALRVERLPERARLSRGRNNGDNSWSLMRDELEDLVYLPPKGMKAPHTLAVRIINLDSDDGATLAVLDLPVASGAGAARPKTAKARETHDGDSAEIRRLENELAEAKSELDLRARELEISRQKGAQLSEKELQGAIATELAEARTAWQAELERRLGEARAEAAAKAEQVRSSWKVEQKERLDKLDSRARKQIEQTREQLQQEARAALSKAEENWAAAEALRLKQTERKWHEESEAALAEAVARCKRAESTLARERNDRHAGNDAEIRALRSALAEAIQKAESSETLKKARDSSNAEERLQQELDRAREQWREELLSAIAHAQEGWKAEETTRFAQSEAGWRDKSSRELADAVSRADRAETALARARSARESSDEVELRRLRAALTETSQTVERSRRTAAAELSAARAAWESELDRRISDLRREEAERLEVNRAAWQAELKNRLADIEAKTQERIDRTREGGRQQAQAAVLEAKKDWKKEEAGRLAQAAARAREDSAHELASAAAQLQRAETELARIAHESVANGELRVELKELRAILSEREQRLQAMESACAESPGNKAAVELAAARQSWQAEEDARTERRVEEARQRWQQESEVAQSKAEENWKKDEAIRYAEAEALLREQLGHPLEVSPGKPHEQVPSQTSAPTDYDAEILRLRAALEKAQLAVAERQAALIQARSEFKRSRERWRVNAEAERRKLSEQWAADEAYRSQMERAQWEREAAMPEAGAAEEAEQPGEPQVSRRLVRDGAAAALLAAMVVFAYPYAAPIIWGRDPPPPTAVTRSRPSSAPPLASARPTMHRAIVGVRQAKIRVDPSPGATVIATLARGSEVVVLEQRENWLRIQTAEAAKALRQGWVYRSALKDTSSQKIPRE